MVYTHSYSQVSSTLRFESSPLRFETVNELQTLTSQTAGSNLKFKSRYSSRSILGPGDLEFMTVLETTCQMLEKYLLSKNPFPTEPELLAVTRYTNPLLYFRLMKLIYS